MLLELAAALQLIGLCEKTVAPPTVADIMRTESGFNPLVIHDNTTGRTFKPETVEEARTLGDGLVGIGHSVDVGLMQVNSANFPSLGLTVASALDPCTNIAAGAKVLAAGYQGGTTDEAQQQALRVAISRYNTGDAQRGFDNGYVHRVEASAGYLVPALKVPGGPAVAAPSIAPTPAALPDPNAPPSWDVWASQDYADHHHAGWQVMPDPMAATPDAADGKEAPSALALHASVLPVGTQ